MCVCVEGSTCVCVYVCVIGAWSRRNLGFTIELIRASFRNFLHYWTHQNAEHSFSFFLQFALALCFIFNILLLFFIFKHYLCLVFCIFVFSFLSLFFCVFNLVKIQFYTCFHSLLLKLTYTAAHLFFFLLSSFLPSSYAKCKKNTTKNKENNINMKHTRIRKYILLENLLFFLFLERAQKNNQSQM